MLNEFKKFALKGNVIDLAVGVIIGAAFGKIVTSLVNDIIMPTLGLLLGKINLTDFKLVIKQATETVPEVAIRYGVFLQSVLDFLIISLSVFLFVKLLSKAKKKEEEKPTVKEVAPDIVLLQEIRDLLKQK